MVLDLAVEVFVEIAAEVFVIQFDWGVRNFVYYCVVVQAGLGFDVDIGTTLYSTVAGR